MNIKLQEQDIYYGNLILVNQENPLHFNNIADLTPVSLLQSNILLKQASKSPILENLEVKLLYKDVLPIACSTSGT